MISLAKRTTKIDSSGIRKVFALAAKMENPINLSIGQPHFDVPEDIKETAIAAIRAGKNSYTQTAGLDEFREKIKRQYVHRGLDLGDVLITSGVSGGILLAFLAVLDEGDEIIIPDPFFVMYKHLANFIGARPVYLDTYPDFQPNPEKLEKLITPRTKAILINSPCNPTGVIFTKEMLQAATKIAEKHGLLIISDEIYEPFLYDQDTLQSPAEFYPYTLILSGFSKSVAMTGWRLGYAYGPKDIVAAMINIQMYSFVCAPSFAQHAGMTALDIDLSPTRADYRRKRDLIYNGLKDRFHVVRPGGAFYIFPEAPNGDGDEFVRQAIENNLLVVPGSVFSERKTHFRISFAAEDHTIERGIEVLNRMADATH
ncbi:MAG: aminotransferase class I/II-fold pyridoxal phosphate-dependent enzyme [Candidatus Omnitrophota bacterium]|jgi:aspartate aminotransferase/aminotransferase|nr:MAG: aminotransferase class I/II-fold pyridoxal phosphate-dependent enzyme [Candidatus Omnitrophota bacterium]